MAMFRDDERFIRDPYPRGREEPPQRSYLLSDPSASRHRLINHSSTRDLSFDGGPSTIHFHPNRSFSNNPPIKRQRLLEHPVERVVEVRRETHGPPRELFHTNDPYHPVRQTFPPHDNFQPNEAFSLTRTITQPRPILNPTPPTVVARKREKQRPPPSVGKKTAARNHPAGAIKMFFPTHRYNDVSHVYDNRLKLSKHTVKLVIPGNKEVFIGMGINNKLARYDAAYQCLHFHNVAGVNEMLPHISAKDKDKMDLLASSERVNSQSHELDKKLPSNLWDTINKMYGPNVKCEITELADVPKKLFKCTLAVQGEKFAELGKNKNIAKQRAMESCYTRFMMKPPTVVKSLDSAQKRPKGRHRDANEMLMLVYKFVEEKTIDLPKDFCLLFNVAGILLKNENEDAQDNVKVIAAAIGRSPIRCELLSNTGLSLNDSAADTIVVRALRLFLMDEIVKTVDGSNDTILEKDTDNKFKLKPNLSLVFAKNFPPNGDASNTPLTRGRRGRKSDVNNMTITETGMMRYYVPKDGVDILKYRMLSQKRIDEAQKECHPVACCSDKLLVKNTAGLQGSLLSLIMHPIYFTDVICGLNFHLETLQRSFHLRISEDLPDLPEPYKLNRPQFLQGDYKGNLPIPKHLEYSGWALSDTPWETIDSFEGVAITSTVVNPPQRDYLSDVAFYERLLEIAQERQASSGPSMLCKKKLFEKFRETAKKVDLDIVGSHYGDSKGLAVDYQKVKKAVKDALYNANLGTWPTKAENLNDFTVE